MNFVGMLQNTHSVLNVQYKNHRGEVTERRIVPQGITFRSTPYHKETQWILEAFDLAKKEARSFAMKDFISVHLVGYVGEL